MKTVTCYPTSSHKADAIAYIEMLDSVVKPLIKMVTIHWNMYKSVLSHMERMIQEWLAKNFHNHVTTNIIYSLLVILIWILWTTMSEMFPRGWPTDSFTILKIHSRLSVWMRTTLSKYAVSSEAIPRLSSRLRQFYWRIFFCSFFNIFLKIYWFFKIK